jgi:acyl carrier protein
MKKNEIMEMLLDFICQNFMVEKNDINLDVSLVDQGIIDSIGLIEISAFIERKFSIKVLEDQMTLENFGSANKIANFIIINQ